MAAVVLALAGSRRAAAARVEAVAAGFQGFLGDHDGSEGEEDGREDLHVEEICEVKDVCNLKHEEKD
ncbi:hypothetical protein K4F52_006215 [Lecanicillium sp. MT-2017a]|nr:hypothetical protein K4F52_006215 [Lecanicillium sp. MT-2017a]